MRTLKTTPLPILIISFLFLILPFMSYLATASFYRVPLLNLGKVFMSMQPFQIAIIIASLFVSFGILSRKLVGYYSFLGFSGIMIVYNLWLVVLFYFGNSFNIAGHSVSGNELWGNFFLTIFLLVSVFYFLNKEISAPYFSTESRGWRKDSRETIPVPFTLRLGDSSWSSNTINISTTGAMVPVSKDFLIEEGDKANIKIEIENMEGEKIFPIFSSIIVRVDSNENLPGDHQVGIRFLDDGDSKDSKEQLNYFLNERYSPRYKVASGISFGKETFQDEEGKIGNISEDGLYIETDKGDFLTGDEIYIRIPSTPPISMEGRVSWANAKGEFGKKPGFGVHIVLNRNPIRYRLWLLKIRIRQLKTR
ncbi:MAG: PilZ domain-containing protein [Leptospira sp.]|nr:PilZ domain-containing protein [Leptospira sp.]